MTTIKNIRRIFLNTKLKRMTERNQNWIAVYVGATGSGKTYAALENADDMMERKFDPKEHLVFSIEEFMKKFNSKVFKKGDIIVFEEAGVNISSKDWQSKANKNINFVLQTCRHRNFGIIFTLPMFKFLDSSTRALIHTAFITDKIDYKTETAYLKVYDFKVDALRGKEPYIISPKFWIDGKKITMKRIAMKLPNKNIIDVYEQRKTKFTNKLNKEIEDQLDYETTEKEKKLNQAVPCEVCRSSYWRYYPSKSCWACRKCGAVKNDNPYKRK